MIGPGTHLMALLETIGIHKALHCSCVKRARWMDSVGPDECERQLDTIVSWLVEEAQRQGWTLIAARDNAPIANVLGITANWLAEHSPESVVRGIAKVLVLHAIWKARNS